MGLTRRGMLAALAALAMPWRKAKAEPSRDLSRLGHPFVDRRCRWDRFTGEPCESYPTLADCAERFDEPIVIRPHRLVMNVKCDPGVSLLPRTLL